MLQVNHERVAKLLQGLASFTDSEEGVTRLAYSPLDKKAQSWLWEQVQDLIGVLLLQEMMCRRKTNRRRYTPVKVIDTLSKR